MCSQPNTGQQRLTHYTVVGALKRRIALVMMEKDIVFLKAISALAAWACVACRLPRLSMVAWSDIAKVC
jgi:hypothetical protein